MFPKSTLNKSGNNSKFPQLRSPSKTPTTKPIVTVSLKRSNHLFEIGNFEVLINGFDACVANFCAQPKGQTYLTIREEKYR